jgi:hypothetical protein
VSARKRVECLNRNERPCNLPFELDAMGLVLGHGFHPLKARAATVNSKPAIYPPLGAHSASASNFDSFERTRSGGSARASERAGVAETGRARVGS